MVLLIGFGTVTWLYSQSAEILTELRSRLEVQLTSSEPGEVVAAYLRLSGEYGVDREALVSLIPNVRWAHLASSVDALSARVSDGFIRVQAAAGAG